MNGSTDVTTSIKNMITNIDSNFASLIIAFMILCIILLSIWYYLYMQRLYTKECNIMTDMYGKLDNYIKSINPSDPNCQYNLEDYYIKSAYNCCSGGTYKNDYVNICNLKNVLKQGVRGLDFEIYSVNNLPVVATSTVPSNYVKETYNYILFSDVMNIIANYAFSTSTAPNPVDPIIFHLRIKSNNQEMYTNLAKIFEANESLFLGPEYSYENNGENLGAAPLLSLSGKIIVIVDKVNDSFMDNKGFYEYVNMTSNSIFMRAMHYYDVKNTPDLNELIQYNKTNMSITMPDIGANPPNPSGIVCRETGAQMIAMRYQKDDVNLEENIAFFDSAGYAYVLKPANLRYIPITIPDAKPQNPALSYASKTAVVANGSTITY